MHENVISDDKIKLLDALLEIYKREVSVIYAINASWEQLKEEAKVRCAEDFDQAIIARETLLEELADLRDSNIVPEAYEFALFSIDQNLLNQGSLVRDLYGLDVHAFFNVKSVKQGLLKK